MEIKIEVSQTLLAELLLELSVPVEETVASDSFRNFVTTGTTGNVPIFSNRAQAFDWWTKTLWYDCKSIYETIQARLRKNLIYEEDIRLANNAMEDAIAFLDIFGTNWKLNPHSLMPSQSVAQCLTLLQAFMKALNEVRQAGLKAGIDATPVIYPPTQTTSKKPKISESQPKKPSEKTSSSNRYPSFDEWGEPYYEWDLEQDNYEIENLWKSIQTRPKPKGRPDYHCLPPEIAPGIKANECPIRKGKFGLPRTIAESLAHSEMSSIREFKNASTLSDKILALDKCITRVQIQCYDDLLEVKQRIAENRKGRGLRNKLKRDHKEAVWLLFSFCARNHLCKAPTLAPQRRTFRWFADFLPQIIKGLVFLGDQFDEEFFFDNWRSRINRQKLLTFDQESEVQVSEYRNA